MNTNILSVSAATPSFILTPTKKWTARILAGLVVAFFASDAAMKVSLAAPVVESSAKLGFSLGAIMTIGIIEVILVVLYLVPRTAVVSAVLWTGYLGGAIATHVRLGDPLFSHTLFPIYVAVLIWLPLYLRDPRVRALVAR